MCRCSVDNIPEVTDLECDYLISNQRSSVDQIVIVYVLSAKKDKTIKEVAKVCRKQNRTRSMPCIQVSVTCIKTDCGIMFTYMS